MVLKIFLHGLESSDQGTKAVFFRNNHPGMVTPHFQGSLSERMAKLKDILSDQSSILIVGSSYGGLMGSIFSMENEVRIKRLILLAPAINLPEFNAFQDRTLDIPVWIFHGSNDTVIPMKEIEPVARRCFRHLEFNRVEDDHYLHKTFQTIDWRRLLS